MLIHRVFSAVLAVLLLCSPTASADRLDKTTIMHHRQIAGTEPWADYGKIVTPGEGQGIGRVIGPVSEHWEMVCFEDGFCLNILNTDKPVETGGGLGCSKVNRMAYTLRQSAAQLNHVAGMRGSAVNQVLNLADAGFELGMAMIALEQCYITEGCKVRDAYEKMIDPGYRNFVLAHKRYHRYIKQYPNAFDAIPEVPRLVDYQAHGIADIIEAIVVVYNPISNEMQLQTGADLSPQNGREICQAIAGQSSCRLLLPR